MRSPLTPVYAKPVVLDEQFREDFNFMDGHMRSCPGCGKEHLLVGRGVCPRCSEPNPFGSGPLAIYIEAGGENSPHPDRVKDGTHIYNVGLPPVETVVGKKRNGKLITEARPVTHHELQNNRGTREYALRAGLEPLSRKGRYRAL